MVYAIDITMRSGKWHIKPYAVQTSFLCLHDAETAYGNDILLSDGCYIVAMLQKLKKRDTHGIENDVSYYVIIRLQPRRIRRD